MNIKFYFLLFIILMGLAILLNQQNQWYIMSISLMLILLISRHAFYIFLKWKFIALLLFLVFGLPLILGERDAQFLGIPYCSKYLKISIVMVNRSIVILLSIKMLTQKISIDQIANGISRIHLTHFSDVFRVALGVLPELRVITKNTFQEFRKREPGKNLFSATYHLTVKLMVRVLYFAEQYHQDQIQNRKFN